MTRTATNPEMGANDRHGPELRFRDHIMYKACLDENLRSLKMA
jgi:hypothetical protein